VKRAEPRAEAGKNGDCSGRALGRTEARSPELWETRLKAAKRAVGGAFRTLVYLGVAIAPPPYSRYPSAMTCMQPSASLIRCAIIVVGLLGPEW